MLTIGHDVGRDALLDSVTAFVTAAGAVDDLALLGASGCHGWSRLDVVTHVLAGWRELVGGPAVRTTEDPTVDAASYWTALAAEEHGHAVDLLLAQRRRSDAYGRPSRAVEELYDVARTLGLVVAGLPDGRHRFQGHVLASGDLLASWAVENAVHHLDLLVDSEAATTALHLVRDTAETLVGERLPASWDDVTAALVATGRLPAPDDAAHLADRLPVLG